MTCRCPTGGSCLVDIEEPLTIRLDVLLTVAVLSKKGRCRDDIGHGLLVRGVDNVAVDALRHRHDGENPVSSKGCFAQAWSVGEILRVYDALR